MKRNSIWHEPLTVIARIFSFKLNLPWHKLVGITLIFFGLWAVASGVVSFTFLARNVKVPESEPEYFSTGGVGVFCFTGLAFMLAGWLFLRRKNWIRLLTAFCLMGASFLIIFGCLFAFFVEKARSEEDLVAYMGAGVVILLGFAGGLFLLNKSVSQEFGKGSAEFLNAESRQPWLERICARGWIAVVLVLLPFFLLSLFTSGLITQGASALLFVIASPISIVYAWAAWKHAPDRLWARAAAIATIPNVLLLSVMLVASGAALLEVKGAIDSKNQDTAEVDRCRCKIADWMHLSPPGMGFVAVMPPRSAETWTTNETKFGQVIKASFSSNQQPGVGFTITCHSYPTNMPVTNAGGLLLADENKIVQRGYKLSYSTEIALRGYEGREARFELDNSRQVRISRAYFVGHKFYELVCVMPKNALCQRHRQLFFDAFDLKSEGFEQGTDTLALFSTGIDDGVERFGF